MRCGATPGCLTGKVACAPGAPGKAAARGGACAEPGRPRSPAPTTHAPGGSAITDAAGGYRLERGNPGRREREGNLAAAAAVRASGEGAPPGGPRPDARRAAGLGGACVLPEPVEEGKAGRGRSAAVAVNSEGWVGGAHSPPRMLLAPGAVAFPGLSLLGSPEPPRAESRAGEGGSRSRRHVKEKHKKKV